MSANDQRVWRESTPAGALHTALGITDEVDHDAVDARVEAVSKTHLRTYGRQLSEQELAAVRVGAELRSGTLSGATPPSSVADLVATVNRTPGTAWRYIPEFGPEGSGIAMLQDGQWVGDPRVIEGVQAAEADRAARDAAAEAAWRNGPLAIRTVGPPT